MATIYKCDRCGSENKNPITKLDIDWKDGLDRNWLIKADLCEPCMWKLKQFTEKLPVEDKR